jgi:hypothetical protein
VGIEKTESAMGERYFAVADRRDVLQQQQAMLIAVAVVAGFVAVSELVVGHSPMAVVQAVVVADFAVAHFVAVVDSASDIAFSAPAVAAVLVVMAKGGVTAPVFSDMLLGGIVDHYFVAPSDFAGLGAPQLRFARRESRSRSVQGWYGRASQSGPGGSQSWPEPSSRSASRPLSPRDRNRVVVGSD